MNNVQEKILFKLLENNQVYVRKKFEEMTIFDYSLCNNDINPMRLRDREIGICEELEIKEEDERMKLITELEEMFFYMGFKSAIKVISDILNN